MPSNCPTQAKGRLEWATRPPANNLSSARTQNFTYDQVNRIVSAGTTSTSGQYCWGYNYGYDGAWGNLTSQSGASGYGACSGTTMSATTNGNNQLIGLTYDGAGNTLSDGINNYTWNGESQLSSAAGVSYSYDGDGRRAAKVGSKFYWYGSGGEILAETDTSGNIQNEYVYFGGRRIAMIPSGQTPLYYAQDMLGSSRVMVQSTGTLCYDADFTPFGAERAYTSTCSSNYKFEGKERDTETGNDDFGARNYSWRYGRWLSADWSSVPSPVPYANLTNPQTLNLYSMVADDPESFADLDGHIMTAQTMDPFTETTTSECDSYAGGDCQSQGGVKKPTAPPEQAQQQNDSSGGHGFWSHVSNLLHGHSWNYGMQEPVPMRESVTTTITFVSDALGVASAVSRNVPLGRVSAAISVVNDPSPLNVTLTGLGLVPGLDVPMAFGTAAWDGSKFVGNQVITPVFTPDASQASTIGDGYGHSIANPAMMDGSELIQH